MWCRRRPGSSSASRPRAPTRPPTCCSPSISAPAGRGPCRDHPADQVRRARQDSARPISRPGRPLVWHLHARARGVCVQGSREDSAITYEELADPKWKGKICIRSGQHIYNNALFGAMIVKHGEAKAEEWLRGLKANLAQKPSGGDREMARDVAAGKCDIGIGNTYYWALMKTGKPTRILGRSHARDPADLRRRRHTCEPVRRRAGEDVAEQGQRASS